MWIGKIWVSKGVILDENGIYDNSGGLSVGLIDWTDVQDIREIEVSSQKIMMIDVSQPEKYIQRAGSKLAKMTMGINSRSYGSPISISANSLRISNDDLKLTLIKAWEEYESEQAN